MIGVLALQGGFAAHQQAMNRLGIPTRPVKLPRDLEGLSGLILPGGESSTMLKLMNNYNFYEPLNQLMTKGLPVLGTCAGAILLCDRVNPEQKSLGWLPAGINRNAYGSQRESFSTNQSLELWGLDEVPVLFIRAPRFTGYGDGVQVLSRHKDEITGLTYKHITAVTYHPELGGSDVFHKTWYQRHVEGH